MNHHDSRLGSRELALELLSHNIHLRSCVSFHLEKVEVKIALLELLIESLSERRSGSSLQKRFRKRIRKGVRKVENNETSPCWVPRRIPSSFSFSTRTRPIKVKEILKCIEPWIPSNFTEWDIYQICVRVNRAAAFSGKGDRQGSSGISLIFPIDPMMIRRALELKAQSVVNIQNEEEVRKMCHLLLINLLLPHNLDCRERIPIRPTSWNRVFMQDSIFTVAEQLKVTPSSLEEIIQKRILDSVSRSVLSVDFDRLSVDICGDERLSSAIFFVAKDLRIRPQV